MFAGASMIWYLCLCVSVIGLCMCVVFVCVCWLIVVFVSVHDVVTWVLYWCACQTVICWSVFTFCVSVRCSCCMRLACVSMTCNVSHVLCVRVHDFCVCVHGLSGLRWFCVCRRCVFHDLCLPMFVCVPWFVFADGFRGLCVRPWFDVLKKMKKRQLWDRGFRRNSSLQDAWDTSIASTTGFMWPHREC